jgi:hypothetical protein
LTQNVNAKGAFNQLLEISVVPLAKDAGFSKSGLTFHRRTTDSTQVINFQLSRGNTSQECRFYVNVGIAFDALFVLANKSIPKKPKEYECHFRQRLEKLVDGIPPIWRVTTETDIKELSDFLSESLEVAIRMLESISSITDFSKHSWFNIPSAPSLPFLIFYALAEYEAAWQEVQDVSKRFSDRRGMTESDLINRYNLEALEPKIANPSA